MEWARNPAANREFERFAAGVSDPLLKVAPLEPGPVDGPPGRLRPPGPGQPHLA
jgi:hypothetical protein